MNPAQQLEAMLALSRAMLDAAQAGEWEALAELEARRREHIDVFFAEPFDPGMAPVVADSIRQLLASDKLVLDLGRQGQSQLTAQLGALHSGARATRAYAQNI